MTKTISERIRRRMESQGLIPAEFARQLGYSPQRLNNYIHETKPRAPDIETLARIARALGTTPDWLMGFSEAAPAEVDIQSAIQRLLELAGMPNDKAEVISEVAQVVLRTLSAAPDEGDARTQARATAAALWLQRQHTKPS